MNKRCISCGEFKDYAQYTNGKPWSDMRHWKKKCFPCAIGDSLHYRELRRRELALIPNPFRVKREEAEGNHHLTIWSVL